MEDTAGLVQTRGMRRCPSPPLDPYHGASSILERSDTMPVSTMLQTRHCAKTSIGDCRLDIPGVIRPLDARHAPIRDYRSYGEWWESRHKAGKDETAMTNSSRSGSL